MTDYRDPNNIDPNGNFPITQLVKFIREKMFGIDVRESIAKALEKAYEDVVEVTDRQATVEEQFQDVIDNTTGKDVISAPELIAARNGKPNLKTRIDDLENETDAQLAQTVKIGTEKRFTPEMQGSFFFIGHPSPRDQVDKYIAMGFDGAVLTMHIDGDANCSIRENMSIVYEVLDYAKEKGLKTNVCKFHATESNVDLTNSSVQQAYVSRVMSILTALEPYGIDTVYLFNEFGVLFRTQTEFCIDTINLIKGLGYRVGVTFQYSDNRNATQTNLDGLMVDIPQLFSAIDIIGLNVYPTITYDWRNATRNDSVKAWSEIYPIMEQMKETFKKPIIFTEAGCYFYYQFLVSPAAWDPSELELQSQDEEAARIFWYGLLNDHRLKSLVDGVYTWFLDQVKDPETIGFFKHYNERM